MKSNEKQVLISGASFAGLTTAFWLKRMGYHITIVELARGLRRGGTAVDIKGNTVDIVRRMGLLDPVRSNRLGLQRFEFKNAADVTERSLVLQNDGDPPSEDEFEIEREVLINMLFDTVKNDCNIVFDESITALRETQDGIVAAFSKGPQRTFDLVFGCDGVHSAVRKMWFGSGAQDMHFLGLYSSVTIVDKLLIERGTAQMYNEPGKAVMLNAYKNKTDIIMSFAPEAEIPYDYRNQEQQRNIILEQFAGCGWRTAELLREMRDANNFYFDKLCQIRIPSWTKGRVALVGDAGYCPSPAAGMGGSLAIDGATALADAMREADGNVEIAFRHYDERFRPFIDQVQADAVKTARDLLVPRTAEAIRARNAQTGASF